MKKSYLFYTFSAFLLNITVCTAQPGTLDTSFDNDGLVTTKAGAIGAQLEAAEILPDGKLLLAGYSLITTESFADGNITLMRYNTDGSPDTSFGNNGVRFTIIENAHIEVRHVMLLPNDKYLVCFTRTLASQTFATAGFARFKSDGSLDTSLNGTGFYYPEINGMKIDFRRILLQPDGKIIAVGGLYQLNQVPRAQVIARYDENMVPDTTFGDQGVWISEYTTDRNAFFAAALQEDGKIVVGGDKRLDVWSAFMVSRFTANGMPDETFGEDGSVMFHFNDFVDQLTSLDIQQDGKIVVAGSTKTLAMPDNTWACAARLTESGVLDETFGTDGKVQFQLNEAPEDGLNDVIIRSNGKILLAGNTRIDDEGDYLLIFLNEDGSPDSAFGENGVVTTSFSEGAQQHSNNLKAIKEQPDGKIVAAGYAWLPEGHHAAIARYHVEGTAAAPGFSSNSGITVYPNPANDIVYMQFSLPQAEEVTVKLYNIRGREIPTQYSGRPVTVLDNTVALPEFAQLAQGVYFLQATTSRGTQAFKIIK